MPASATLRIRRRIQLEGRFEDCTFEHRSPPGTTSISPCCIHEPEWILALAIKAIESLSGIASVVTEL